MFSIIKLKDNNQKYSWIVNNGIFSSRDGEIFYSFSESSFLKKLGYFQSLFLLIKGFLSCLIPINIILNLEESSFKNLSNEIEVLIIWPKNLWGGFSKDKIPDNLQKKKFGVVFLKKRYITLSFREFIEKINLIWFLIFKLKGLKGISKLSSMAWCFSQQPFSMSNMISNLEKKFTILKSFKNKIKYIYYPFEFYPESKICFKIAKDFKLKSMTAQHMKWTNEKLSRFTGQSELVELPEIIFLSKQQNSNIFNDLKIKYKRLIG